MRDLSYTLSDKPTKRSKASPYVINIGIIACILFLTLTYLFSLNAMTTQAFKIKQLNLQLSKLEAEHNSLELENSNLQSVTTIEAQTRKLNFIPTTSITYIKDDNVALK